MSRGFLRFVAKSELLASCTPLSPFFSLFSHFILSPFFCPPTVARLRALKLTKNYNIVQIVSRLRRYITELVPPKGSSLFSSLEKPPAKLSRRLNARRPVLRPASFTREAFIMKYPRVSIFHALNAPAACAFARTRNFSANFSGAKNSGHFRRAGLAGRRKGLLLRHRELRGGDAIATSSRASF